MKNLKLIYLLSFILLLTSCGEEVLTKGNQSVKLTTSELASFELSTCSQMHFEKPPVDILYIIDNSGSTMAGSFQQIKTEIQNTIFNISNEFDYHIYFAPLNASSGDTISGYPLMLSDPSSVNGIANLNVVTVNSLNMFSQASGNNSEHGFTRAQNIIDTNRSAGNNIFRDKANTLVVMISNGDDTESNITIGGNTVFDPAVFSNLKNKFKAYKQAPMQAESFRFISLVAHSPCNLWSTGVNYKRMSNELYSELHCSEADPQDNPSDCKISPPENNPKDSHDLCSGNYQNLFAAVNSSIQQVLIGHKYDHWKISSAASSSIQEDDITLTKINADGSKVNVPSDETNGFEYLGHKTDWPTRYDPIGEEVTGLVVKLNGNARIKYPECLIAKTRTPTEFFGYISLPQKPDESTIEVKIDGKVVAKSSTDGWSVHNNFEYTETLNIKVPGPSGASILPALNKSGYFIKLNGSAIFTNGQTINVYYKAAAI